MYQFYWLYKQARIEDYAFMGWMQRGLVDRYQRFGGKSPS